MKTIFFTQDQELCLLQELEHITFHQTSDPKKVESLIMDEPVVLVLDYDLNEKAAAKLNKAYVDQSMVHRIVVRQEFLPKEIKKLQKGADAANGYFSKPLDMQMFKELVADFAMIMGMDEQSTEEIDYNTSQTAPTKLTDTIDEDKTDPNVGIPREIADDVDLVGNDEIPEHLESADGDVLNFDEADSNIAFDVGDGVDQDDVTDPGMTSPTLAENVPVEEEEEVQFGADEKEEIEPESSALEDEDEVEFDLGEDEDEVEFDLGAEEEVELESPALEEEDEVEFDLGADEEIESESSAPDDEDEVEFDLGAEDSTGTQDEIDFGEEAEVVDSNDVSGIELSLDSDDSFGEIELSNKSSSVGEDESPKIVDEGRVDEDVTGEFETVVTELSSGSELVDDQPEPEEEIIEESADESNAVEEVNISDDVKVLSDEEKSAIARIEKIDYTYDENELVKSQVTIRHMREERQSLLKEIELLKNSGKQKEQDLISLRAELDETKIEVTILKKRRNEDTENIKYQLRLSDEKKKIYEEKFKHYQDEFKKLDQKVRVDINQVRQKEKDLENKLELTVMDADSQIKSRDMKIAELKRKVDSLEFNMENVSINEQKMKEDKLRLEARISKIMSTLRNSISLIEDDLDFDDEVLLEKLNKI